MVLYKLLFILAYSKQEIHFSLTLNMQLFDCSDKIVKSLQGILCV